MKYHEDVSTALENLQKAILVLVAAYDASESDEDRKALVVDPVTDAESSASISCLAAYLMMLDLQRFVSDILGKSARRLPSKEEGAAFLDSILDAEQPKLFVLMREYFPDNGDADLERLLIHHGERLRALCHEKLEG